MKKGAENIMHWSNEASMLGRFVDRAEWTYWDTVFASAAKFPRYVHAFSLYVGSFDANIGRVLTLHDTNMISRGRESGFGHTRCLILREMGIYFPLWLSSKQIDALLSRSTLVFQIAEKVFYESRFDFREGVNDGKPLTNTYPPGEDGHLGEEIFDRAQFSGRMVQIKVKEDNFAKYIPPLVPFTFRIDLGDEPAPFDFDGVQPIMIPTMSGLTDRAVQ